VVGCRSLSWELTFIRSKLWHCPITSQEHSVPMLYWSLHKEFLCILSVQNQLDLLTLCSTELACIAGTTFQNLRRTIDALVLYPLMDLGALILGIMIIVALKWMRCRIADSGIMIPLISSQISSVIHIVALIFGISQIHKDNY
jgi:hypothetical protein